MTIYTKELIFPYYSVYFKAIYESLGCLKGYTIFPYYSVYFKAPDTPTRYSIGLKYFHTIQSILKRYSDGFIHWLGLVFPYYSVYFKAFIIDIFMFIVIWNFHTIQSILKHRYVVGCNHKNRNFHTIQSILKLYHNRLVIVLR